MHIAILGAGALGTLVGAKLWSGGGPSVTLIGKGPHIEALAERGVRLIETDGAEVYLRGEGLSVVSDAARVDGDIDYLIVTTKGPDFAQAVADAGSLPPVGCALTLQNGIGFDERLGTAFGSDRVIGAVTMEGAASPEPGTVQHILAAVTYLGESGTGVSERVEALAAIFRSGGLPAAAVPDIRPARWTKFVQSCAASGVCGATRLGYAPATATAAGSDLYVRLVREGLAVMAAAGFEPGPYLGDAASVVDVGRGSPAEASELVRSRARVLIDSGYVGGTSLLRDLEGGVVTEAEFLMGDMVRAGADLGVATPTMSAIYLAVAAADQSR